MNRRLPACPSFMVIAQEIDMIHPFLNTSKFEKYQCMKLFNKFLKSIKLLNASRFREAVLLLVE